MIRIALIASIVALAFASTASGGVYAFISADWSNSSSVKVTVVSDHRFGGAVSDSCVPVGGPPAVTNSSALGDWVFDATAQQYTDDVTFDMSAAGKGANCTITVTDGHKTLRSQSYVSPSL
jgi:hypothetical protein